MRCTAQKHRLTVAQHAKASPLRFYLSCPTKSVLKSVLNMFVWLQQCGGTLSPGAPINYGLHCTHLQCVSHGPWDTGLQELGAFKKRVAHTCRASTCCLARLMRWQFCSWSSRHTTSISTARTSHSVRHCSLTAAEDASS